MTGMQCSCNVHVFLVLKNPNLHLSVFCRCNVVINFFENAHKVSVSEESCDDCGANLLEVDFIKVMT